MADVKRTARTKRRLQANVVRTLAEEIVPGNTELFPSSKRQQESVELLRMLMESSSEEERSDSENSLDITVESNQEGQPELESPNVFIPDSPPSLASQQRDCDGADHESNSSRCGSSFRLEADLTSDDSQLGTDSEDAGSDDITNKGIGVVNDLFFSESDELSEIESTNVAHSYSESHQIPLHPGCNIKEDEFYVAVLSLVQRHKLTYACLSDLLELLNKTLPQPNALCVTAMRLIRKYVKFEKETILHKCCGSCLAPLPGRGECLNPACRTASEPDAVFLEIPLDQQIQERMADAHFAEQLRYRFSREVRPGYLEDIYDGMLYQEQAEFFQHPFNISFTMNYDGAPKFKSSGMQVWPVQLCINELPPSVRKAKRNILVADLWCATEKPRTSAFLKPILEQLKTLEMKGITVATSHSGEIVCKAKLLLVVADLPAKASLLNCNQFNGHYGCSTCLHEGRQVRKGRGSTRVYEYQPVNIRTQEQHILHGLQAERTHKVVFGVKGPSPLLQYLPSFDIVRQVPVDYMHCVLLGIVRKLLDLWFGSAHHMEEWYIGHKVREVDKRLLSIKPPDVVERVPRSIRQHRRFWKAQECRNFLLYYIPTTLTGILPNKYFSHVLLLMKAIRLLLGNSLSNEDIANAEELLDTFWQLYEQYYGVAHCTINVHLLSHMPFFVRLCGPLWTHSAFPFEGFMGHLLEQTHSTHDIANQMITSMLLGSRLPVLRAQIATSRSCPVEFQVFLARFDAGSLQRYTTASLSHDIQSVGQQSYATVNSEHLIAVNQLMQQCKLQQISASSCVKTYPKVKVNGQIIFSRNVPRVRKRNSYTIAYRTSTCNSIQYGIVEKFISYPAENLLDANHITILTPLEVEPLPSIDYPPGVHADGGFLCSDFVSTKELASYTAIFTSSIIMKCFSTATNESSEYGMTFLVNETVYALRSLQCNNNILASYSKR